jgi:hypothetical protein
MEVLELKLQVFGITGLQYIPDRIDDGCFTCVVFPDQRGNTWVEGDLQATVILAKLAEIF